MHAAVPHCCLRLLLLPLSIPLSLEASVRRRSAMVCTSSNCLQASRHPTIVLYSHHCMHRLHTGSRVLAEGCQMSSLRVKVADVPRLISWEATMLPVGDSICIDYRFDEVKYSRRIDLLTTIGFLTTLQLAAVLHSKSLKHLSFSKQLQAELRRLVSNGVCWMGVPCSSWVWMLLSCKLQYTCPFLIPQSKFLSACAPDIIGAEQQRSAPVCQHQDRDPVFVRVDHSSKTLDQDAGATRTSKMQTDSLDESAI